MENKKVMVASNGSLPSCSIGTIIADSKCAEQMPFIQSEPVIITNPYKFEVLRPAKATQKPTQGGAYNCRKPKYKTKKRR